MLRAGTVPSRGATPLETQLQPSSGAVLALRAWDRCWTLREHPRCPCQRALPAQGCCHLPGLALSPRLPLCHCHGHSTAWGLQASVIIPQEGDKPAVRAPGGLRTRLSLPGTIQRGQTWHRRAQIQIQGQAEQPRAPQSHPRKAVPSPVWGPEPLPVFVCAPRWCSGAGEAPRSRKINISLIRAVHFCRGAAFIFMRGKMMWENDVEKLCQRLCCSWSPA